MRPDSKINPGQTVISCRDRVGSGTCDAFISVTCARNEQPLFQSFVFSGKLTIYSEIPISLTFNGNENWLEKSGVRDIGPDKMATQFAKCSLSGQSGYRIVC